MARFRYAHQAALDVAVARENEASRAFAIARRAYDTGAVTLERLATSDATVRAQMRGGIPAFRNGRWSRGVSVSATPPPVPLAAFLAVGDGALAVVAARRAHAASRVADLTARVATARDELVRRVREREALERHRGRAREVHERVAAEADEVAADEAATLAYGARVREAESAAW